MDSLHKHTACTNIQPATVYADLLQAELVQERLSRHIQHLLKFGRNTYDPLQYNAVVADIDHPLLINAGITCCPCLMDTACLLCDC